MCLLRYLENIFISATMMELKLNCIGEESASDVEMSAVNTNNNALNLPLEEEVHSKLNFWQKRNVTFTLRT